MRGSWSKTVCRHSTRWIGAALAATAALALMAAPVLAGAPKGSRDNPIRIGSLRITGFAPSYLLQEMGARNGVYFDVIDFPRTTERLAALLRGDIDLAFAGWTGLITLVAKGDPVVAVAGAFNGGYTLTVGANSGIQALADLKGKKIAYSIGSNAELHLYSQLELAGLSVRDVDAVHMSFPDMPLALARGDIDACFCSEPQSSIAIHQGFGRLLKYPYDTPVRDLNGVLVTTRRFLQENRQAVKATLLWTVLATDYLNTFYGRYLQVGKDLFKQPDPIVELALKNTRLTYAVDVDAVRAMAQWQMRLGQIPSVPDVARFVDVSVLEEVLSGR